VTIVALELLRERVAGDTERRLAGDVLAGVVSGELAGAELERRLQPFGIARDVAAIVIARAATNGARTPAARELEDALEGALREDAVACLVATTDGLTCALVAGGDDLEPLAGTVARRLKRTIGVGRPVAGAQARRSFHEARCAAEAIDLQAEPADGAPRAGRVATYKDLGSFQLLLSLQDQEALRLFCDSILGPIEAGDGHYGGELMRSLEAFIEENGQWERAAKRLYCHRHTLRYRIRRVEELTGRSLSSARDRIEFWLALRGREITT
jgi:PucR family transcriptional regulator, purine catabolism regulatory protein